MLQFALSFAHVHKHDLAFSGFGRTNVESLRHAGPPRQAVTQLPARLADHDDNSNLLLGLAAVELFITGCFGKSASAAIR
ncbi:hypothetical protein OZ411_07840 [Bradyrhizobium sp. Arg237L]|uniref:hypothetical protein n=1 Tax=Bradyrhizobium sp. Arg237L TaxID=3003352 RepID=UPI00249DF4D9|nr:hypothetical protein [Bradyrhizobium sp. Arg237L]MDI4232720.1 hypothetical protein [Bradyrhizobium sp. Arg237L]